MKILVVTGRLAEAAVRKASLDSADVLVLPIPVAALITPQKLITGFSASEFSENTYDAVLVSGFSKFNFSKAEDAVGSPIYLGPKHAADLKEALSAQVFSKTVPACELIRSQKSEKAGEILRKCEADEIPSFHIGSIGSIDSTGYVSIDSTGPLGFVSINSTGPLGSVSIGGNARMKVLAEIVAAESLSEEALRSQVLYLISEGADMIDLGFSPDAEESAVSSVFSFVKSFCPIPISVDAGEFFQLRAGIANGADLVLSVDSRILNEYAALLSLKDYVSYPIFDRTAFVVIPDLFSDANRLETLEQNISAARALGIKKIIADPILSPPGKDLFSSLVDYYEFHRRHPDIPVLFGAGNVTELFDADSVGMNALLAELAGECGAAVLFTPNASDKGKGSVRELKTASEMAVLAKVRASSPKDLGVDLLILKEKRRRPDFNLKLISESGAFDRLHLRDAEIENLQNQSRTSGIENKPENKSENESTESIKSIKLNESIESIELAESAETAESFESDFLSGKTLFLAGALNPAFSAGTKWGWKSDPSGNFLIGVLSADVLADYLIQNGKLPENGAEIQKLKTVETPGRRLILAVHQKAFIVGTDSAFMLETILNEGLISELSHAGYLGRELQKAEIAVLFGRSYSQDDVF
ncbi:hypothetical protein MmiAt1_01420 [Methanimicrococcus sp. At1]|uniref:Pterin-binding domain-containing protein n=1 Tax=Methanimicrococcus hacksteinii TaxID=3028293 RepID=A0ABU3VMH8_9EURY|nr:hypothetical protein [Methanimicrococcus sp. At1]MDV0444612.1 hypothetical protein [Methanimicrococcus sp. At1]